MDRMTAMRAVISGVSAAATLVGTAGVANAASAAAVGGSEVGLQSHSRAVATVGYRQARGGGRGFGRKAASMHDAKAAAMQQRTHLSANVGSARAVDERLAEHLAVSTAQRNSAPTSHAQVPAATSTPTSLTVTGNSGVLQFTAVSTDQYVVFEFDGVTTGDPVLVDTSSGAAGTSFPSWGYTNAPHTVTAADCDTADVSTCNVQAPASADVTLANQQPSITKPLSGERITGGFVIAANSTGGGVRFLIDGRRKGFDATSPYRFSYTGSALSAGRHVVTVAQCSTDETRCAGPVSARIPIVSESLHPRIVSVSPSPFSPAKNGVKDTTTLTYALPDREDVRAVVTNSRHQIVRGPIHLGRLRAARHTWTWNGRSGSGQLLASGRYRITLNTDRIVRDTTVRGKVWRSVTIDDRAPSVSGISAPKEIYPVHDGYRDAMDIRARLSERAKVLLAVRNANGRVIDRAGARRGAGILRLRWNGRDHHNTLVPGRYHWSLAITDVAGNTTRTRSRYVTVSPKRLVSHRTTLTRTGASYNSAGSTDKSCASTSKSLSQYKHGVWLLNTCFGESALTATFYRFRLPAAARYAHLGVLADGFTEYPPSSIEAAFGVNGRGRSFKIVKLGQVPNRSRGWWELGGLKGTNYVSPRHRALLAIALDSRDAPTDFDLAAVKLVVRYQVLQ